MSNMNRRFWRDLKEAVCSTELKDCGIVVEPQQSSDVTVYIKGPNDSCYEGGEFAVSFNFPQRYPFAGPKVNFCSKVWHPNISSRTGEVCLDVLISNWIPSMTVATAALSVQNLLQNPEASDALDGSVGAQMLRDINLFHNTARHWTAVYAGGPNLNVQFQEVTNEMVEMGFHLHEAIQALSECDWKRDEAVAAIVS